MLVKSAQLGRMASSLSPLRSVLSVSARSFSVSSLRASNVGSLPIVLPDGVSISVQDKKLDEIYKLRMEQESRRGGKAKIYLTKSVNIEGPNGSLTLDLADFVKIDNTDSKVTVSVQNDEQSHQRQMWGTTRTLVQNGVVGVSEGHIAIVKFVGTGFRALKEKTAAGREYLSLRLGYCVPQVVNIPKDIKVSVPLPHRLVVEGVDKQRVKQLAAKIRQHRPPEPYKGKGIFVDGETIKLKQRKIK